jgi:DNA invertase Pin-like site-specific DNA recombinase
MSKRTALYLRVSTSGQTVDNQRRELEAAAIRHGWNVVATYQDAGISGAKGRDKRPGLDKLLKAVARRDVDMVASWSVDRLGRSLQDLVVILGDLHAKGVDLYLHQQGLDTSTPSGRAFFQVLGVFAEFERAMIQERIKAGLARVREQGSKSGKPIGRPRVEAKKETKIRAGRARGWGVLKIAREVGVGVSVVQRVLADDVSANKIGLR